MAALAAGAAAILMAALAAGAGAAAILMAALAAGAGAAAELFFLSLHASCLLLLLSLAGRALPRLRVVVGAAEEMASLARLLQQKLISSIPSRDSKMTRAHILSATQSLYKARTWATLGERCDLVGAGGGELTVTPAGGCTECTPLLPATSAQEGAIVGGRGVTSLFVSTPR